MYLMIFEGDEPKYSVDVNSSDLNASDNGFLDIIDISDPENPKAYLEGEWHVLLPWRNDERR